MYVLVYYAGTSVDDGATVREFESASEAADFIKEKDLNYEGYAIVKGSIVKNFGGKSAHFNFLKHNKHYK